MSGGPKEFLWLSQAKNLGISLKRCLAVVLASLSDGVGQFALSPEEQNYDVGNRELLAIKLTLEEWRHWLEGATHPFTIITEHKNLQYLREAKRLNPRQARWALFLTRFNFKITYPPSSGTWTGRSSKPPSRSQLCRNAQKGRSTYLAPSIIPFWAQLTNLRALDTQAADGPSRSFKLITGGPVCTVIPSGKLVPLPIPQRPWSHLGVDFITDLRNSEGNTCVLAIVDKFSKSCKFIPLKGLPTALETAEHLFQHVFHHFGLPEEIVQMARLRERSKSWDVTSGHTEHSWSRFLPWADCRPLVSRERENVGLSTPSSTAGSSPTQELRRRQKEGSTLIPTRGSSLAVHRRPVTCDYTLGAEAELPPPELLDQPSIYMVHEILDSRHRLGGVCLPQNLRLKEGKILLAQLGLKPETFWGGKPVLI
ncbi:Transposon Tf2-9 polyprotein [Labeo rohita]|uniref:Transposon Tf2-9 polyprotein n=1 Tax=Labeo rohita TaxID=84645 RepID=A0ABQ8L7C4_LABRO|nr:Transposon Tf2-9 polyprotein [Labeo rohita]